MLKECTFKTSSKQTQKLEQNMDIHKAFKKSCLSINMFFPHKLMYPY